MPWLSRDGLSVEGERLRSAGHEQRGTRLKEAIAKEGRYGVKIISGLVRLGLCNLEADLDNLGADVHSFGYGGTGKKSHQGDFVDYGEPFKAGDHLELRARRDKALSIHFCLNGKDLGEAFRVEAAGPLFFAVCGRDFQVELTSPLEPLCDFFGRAPPVSSALQDWLRHRGAACGVRGGREVRRVQRQQRLHSGHCFTIIDSQPAGKASQDRSYLRSPLLWEALPRGHAEIRWEDEMVCEVAGLRKFGSAEEKFGPLAREAGGARSLTKRLQGAMNAVGDASELVMVFLTKENGELCKISFFQAGSETFLALGSKNVTLVTCLRSKELALLDLQTYQEDRYGFAKEMALVFLDRIFTITAQQRAEMIDFVIKNRATLCGESISPVHQHIQSYRNTQGEIQAQLRFFSITSASLPFTEGLTVLEPLAAKRLFAAWGLAQVELCEEVLVSETQKVEDLERKHLLLENREGAVVYVVLRKEGQSRTAVVYKWKNAWYVTVRALREKFTKRISEARIRQRIRLLHLHHPREPEIVEDFLSFYRFALLLLPVQHFEELGRLWVVLKASHAAYEARHLPAADGDWRQILSGLEMLSSRWLDIFPRLYTALQARLSPERLLELLRTRRELLELPDEDVEDDWPEQVVQRLLALEELTCQAHEAPTLTAVLVRGLQGSGKSTLCRALAQLTMGQWINQDEVSKGARNGKELFLQALRSAAGKPEVRHIFIDKIHTLKQHREDVITAVSEGLQGRGLSLALLNLCHPLDDEGEYQAAAPVCGARIAARGLGHLSLLPQATDADSVVYKAAQEAEVLSDEEKCSYDLCADLDLRLPRLQLLEEAISKLQQGGLAGSFRDEDLHAALGASQEHELALAARWKTLYWMIALDWDFLWQPSSSELLGILSDVAQMPQLSAVEPHVTLAWLGGAEGPAELCSLEGQQASVTITAVYYDVTLGLVALRVSLDGPCASLCQNLQPHITVAKAPGVAAKQSNKLLEGGALRELSRAVRVTGVVQRQLAAESLRSLACGELEGHPLCDLGLAATREAVDIWFSHDASLRLKRLERSLNSLPCSVSQPLLHCKGWPPEMKGKKWFTFHERPLSAESRATLEQLQKKGLISTLHAAVAYVHLEDLSQELPTSLESLTTRLAALLRRRLADALRCAAELLLEVQRPSFYVQCKGGNQEQTSLLRKALAAAVSSELVWRPEIKEAQLTLTAHVKEDWILLGLVMASAAAPKVVPKAKAAVAPNGAAPKPFKGDGVLQIDGATLEGGGQLLRNAAAYAATLKRAIQVENVRGGRSSPGLRPSHRAALEALAKLCGAELELKSTSVAFDARRGQGEVVEVDAGTGGSTMLMLQALLPSMLERREVELIFKGGTNVCSPPGKGAFQINAPQVDYIQLVLFPMLRRLFDIRLHMEVRRRGFLQGGGEVSVRAESPWPLAAMQLLEPGEIVAGKGRAYRSAGVPKAVLPRMLEGEMKRRPSGAAVVLKEQLPHVEVEWDCQECPSANECDACGLVVALQSSTNCLFAGDSMGRRGTSAETVGEEAARLALAAYGRQGCCDEHLEDQLVIFMALARGTSRLRLGRCPSLHFRTALWLAENFGARLRIVDGVLEVQGVGEALA